MKRRTFIASVAAAAVAPVIARVAPRSPTYFGIDLAGRDDREAILMLVRDSRGNLVASPYGVTRIWADNVLVWQAAA